MYKNFDIGKGYHMLNIDKKSNIRKNYTSKKDMKIKVKLCSTVLQFPRICRK